MNSGDLAPQGSFAQTGTVDWVRLGDSVVAQSYKVLARLVNHGVDQFTIQLGLHIAQHIPLGPAGKIHVREAVRDLGFYQALNEELLLGMGPQSIPHLLKTSVEGLTLLAISAALSEVYVEEVAAEVLHEILLHLKPPRELTPSLLSWSKIVKGCAGTLAKSTFGIMAEKFMNFHPSETSLFPTRKAEEHDHYSSMWRSRSHAKDIAKALLTLGEVSRDKLESVTIIGGGDSGFLAAVAEWLFDLKIVIVGKDKHAKGNHRNDIIELYRNSAPGSTVQARFEFKDRMDESPSQRTELEVFEYSRKTVRLRDVSDVLFANDSNEVMKVSGRLEWSRCLSSAFGYAFDTLLESKENFGRVLGSAGRIFRAVATAEQGISLRSRRYWIYYRDTVNRFGFVQNLVFWFPELKSIERIAQRAAACELVDARANYESSLSNLATSCSCVYCDRTETGQPRTGYCLVAVAETILKAGLILSNVSIDPGLNPTRIGFNRLYEVQIEARPRDIDACERREEDLGRIVWVIEPPKEDEYLHPVDHRMRAVLDGALGLFTSLREVENSITCALASGGVCAYWKILEGLSLHDDHGYALGQIHIVPGRIEWNDIAFDRIEDWYDNSSDEFATMQDGIIDLKEMEFREPSLKMEQTLNALRLSYCLTNSKQHVLTIPPTWLVNAAIEAHGMFPCRKRQSCSREARLFERTPQYETGTYRGRQVALYQAPNDHSVCAALAMCELLPSEYTVIINDNCKTCTLDMAVAEFETQDRLLIVSYR